MKFNILNKFFVIPFFLFMLFVIGGLLAFIFIDSGESKQSTYADWNLNSNLKFSVVKEDNTLFYTISRSSKVIQKVALGTEFNFKSKSYKETKKDKTITLTGISHTVEIKVDIDTTDYVQIHVNRDLKRNEKVMDCFYLSTADTHWYGGPEQKKQYWPINEMKFTNNDYLSKELHSAGISERYWLNSKGLFIYINDRVPLFIHQNSDISKDRICYEAKKELPFYTHDEKNFIFNYVIGIASNARLAHMQAVNRFLGKPDGIPDERMTKYPIWSTWVRYGRAINSTIITDFADEIEANGFNHAQIDIDDLWESCYGSMELHPQLSDMKTLTTSLRGRGFRTTLWIHPFINKNCEPFYTKAIEDGLLTINHNGSYDTRWWNSADLDEAAYLDFTKPATREYFKTKLAYLQEIAGIDSFKFDAGETSWTPTDPILEGPTDFYPSQITTSFLETVTTVKNPSMMEIRVGQGTQHYPYFVRMLDLDSRWTFENGLPTMVPTLLQLAMTGYPFILPDMIGGNNYNDDKITKELFIRWLQVTALMPALQFSVTPWDFDLQTINIALKFTQLHEQYSDLIIQRFRLVAQTGEPVNPPIWWIDPEDTVALGVGDQFLIGESLIVAPVVIESQVDRDVYLPKGKWRDGNDADKVHVGPIWIRHYNAPLEVLPYFIKEDQ